MPFLSIFRKDKDNSPSPSTFSRARSRPSVASSRATSPPPQLGDISPQSDLSYVLPELEELQIHKTEEKEPVKKRAVLTRRRESAQSIPTPRTSTTSPPRPASEALIDRVPPLSPTNANTTNLTFDSDDDPLVPPPPRASVFAGYSYSDQDRPRAQTVPIQTERPRPPRELPLHLRDDMKKARKDGSGRGLFGWRKPKEVTVVTEPTESSFSLKSFRHVGPPSPVVLPEESTASLPVAASVDSSPTIGASSSSTARPVPGRSDPVTRERVNSTSSEGVMTAGLFRQAARRSSTNLVEEAAEPIRSRMRDLEKRGPPTRSWAEDSTISSGSDRPRKSAPDASSRPIPRQSLVDMRSDDEPESPSPFAGRLGESGRTSPFATRSESGHARVDYSMYGARSDGGIRSSSKLASSGLLSRAQSPQPVASRVFSASPAQIPSSLPNTKPGPQGYTGPRTTSPTKPRPSSPEKSRTPASPTKPRMSAPAATRSTRSPIRTTIPTKTNDGPTIRPGQAKTGQGKMHRKGSESSQSSVHQPSIRAAQAALGHGRRPSMGESARSVTVDVLSHSRQPSADTLSQTRGGIETRRPSVGALSQSRSNVSLSQDPFSQSRPSADILSRGPESRRPSVDVLSHTRRPSAFEVVSRPKSPGPSVAVDARPAQVKTTDQLRQEAIEAMRGGAEVTRNGSSSTDTSRTNSTGPTRTSPLERAKSPAPSTASRTNTDTATPRKNYVPPPRMSSLAAGLVDSDTDESPEEERESESEGLGFGKGAGVGAMRGRHGKEGPAKTGLLGKGTNVATGKSVAGMGKNSSPGTGKTSPVAGKNSTSSKVSSPAGSPGTLSKESTSPRMGNRSAQHSRSNSDDQPGLTRERTITQRDAPRIGVSLFDSPVSRTRASHSTSAIGAAATARNAATLAEANRAMGVNRPGKHTRMGSFGAASLVRAPVGTDTDEDEDESEESSEDDAPLSSLAPAKRPGSAASTASTRPGPRPSLPTLQSRATAPLINIPGVTSPPPRPPRINRVPGVGVTRNSSLRGSRSVEDLGRMPAVRPGPRPLVTSPPSSTGDSSSGKAPLTPRDGSEAGRDRSDEARRKERRRSEAKKSVELGNVINGPGPIPDDEDEDMSMGHSQMHAMGMMGMGWNQSGFFPPGGAGFGSGFPTSQSMPFLHPQMTGQAMPPMGFMPPPPPPGASEAYLQAHQQAMMIAKQTYLSAVAQQAMAAATEQWERSSNMGGSVYGGSQVSMNMGMMGVPMMGMYAGSAYAASAYEGSVAGWGSASAYGGPSGPRSVYGGGARSEFGGRTKPGAGPNRTRGKPAGESQTRRDPVPPSTWATRRKAGL
ncbi:unnamed protein product [Rhizoctonia solani]|uniref:Uncharacterized protein n=1 Tax=Rhizoctonia solani TaxID=456999 RepID=A0A8H3DJM0_9AGAM|nr:unnamed protein product [Rhizoctonia solani]